ncbi:glycosyltransferase family 4 protein [Patescibacteria group bacterium]|nr:glycosyltransferase family 4 protein [Patescibacteria group bacterium]
MLRVSTWFANYIFTATPKAFPFLSEKVLAIGHGIDAHFSSVPRFKSDSRLNVISVGRISSRKRVRESITLFAEILKQNSKAYFTWVGEPLTKDDYDYYREVLHDIENLDLRGRVKFKGRVFFEEMPKFYASADLLIHLSETGSLDKVVLEAVVAGCPVLSSSSATNEAIQEAYWGGPIDSKAAIEAVNRAKQGISQDKRQNIADSFSIEQLINKIVDACLK